jgi:hypothetical protein
LIEAEREQIEALVVADDVVRLLGLDRVADVDVGIDDSPFADDWLTGKVAGRATISEAGAGAERRSSSTEPSPSATISTARSSSTPEETTLKTLPSNE